MTDATDQSLHDTDRDAGAVPVSTPQAPGALPAGVAPSGVSVGARVLRQEAAALETLADRLDGAFDRALAIIAAIRGRVVVTGMGKSGHVARKIAATLASTGTPALFVHPGEASHGDLGMIGRTDAVIALSNSGDTAELAAIIAYTRRFSIPLIGMTRRPASTLAEQSDVLLLLPPVPEACPHGLAPTTSTTLMLALGDALAIALLERRGFTADDFHELHPGGQLGRGLVKVADIMHTGDDLPLSGLESRLADTILEMSAKRFGCVGIVNGNGQLAGVITDGDLRRHMTPNLFTQSAADVMTPRPKTIRPGALVAEAVGQMNALKITSLFVTEGGRPVGIVHIHDCLKAGVV